MFTEKITNNMGIYFSGPLLIKPKLNKDERGYFFESWNQRVFNKLFNKDISFYQDNESYSTHGVLRGLHFQLNPNSQGKLIKVSHGEIFDVILDLRKDSPTFLNWFGIKLNDTNNFQIWVPSGFAHGFLTLSIEARVSYKVTSYWTKEYERTLIWNDPKISIEWPLNKLNIPAPILSTKDLNGNYIEDLIKKGETF